jgi:hypothetical protein
MYGVVSKPPWKYIEFLKSPIYINPNTTTQPWEDKTPEDIVLLKQGIGEKEKNQSWDLIKRITNPYELIFTSSSHASLPSSIALLKPLSRSFFKFVEMIELSKFFETVKPQKYRSLHLCEGPGGFIEGFLDRACRYRRTVSGVWAMTLKQTHHSIPGWRAASKLLSRHPEIHIEYGPNGNGNILEPENQNYLEKLLKPTGVHIVTADGGFDFSSDFEAQEKNILPLLVASSFIALSCLASQGYFILKIFDSYSPATISFLGFLASHFKDFTIYKPVTSRPCNSERYFIGRGFRGFTQASRNVFQTISNPEIYLENPTEDIVNAINSLTKGYVEQQRSALQRVLTFDETAANIQALWAEQEENSLSWCQSFHIPARSLLRTNNRVNISIH